MLSWWMGGGELVDGGSGELVDGGGGRRMNGRMDETALQES